jgi:hypothetical protein
MHDCKCHFPERHQTLHLTPGSALASSRNGIKCWDYVSFSVFSKLDSFLDVPTYFPAGIPGMSSRSAMPSSTSSVAWPPRSQVFLRTVSCKWTELAICLDGDGSLSYVSIHSNSVVLTPQIDRRPHHRRLRHCWLLPDRRLSRTRLQILALLGRPRSQIYGCPH